MRNWLLLLAVLVVGLLFFWGTRTVAQDIPDTFAIDKASRIRWIDSEILDLKFERICVVKSTNRAEMRKCNR